VHFDNEFLPIEDYPYAGLDFEADPKLVLLEGSTWGDIGNEFFKFLLFHFSVFKIISRK